MTVLNGGLTRAKGIAEMSDFIDEFIDHITPDEWLVLAFLPNITHVTELVAVVAEIRSAPDYPLPPEHPLNPASRYEVAS